MSKLPRAVMAIDSTIARCRPVRSANQPKKIPPRGRITNPAAKTPRVASIADTGSAGLKNWLAKNGAKIA